MKIIEFLLRRPIAVCMTFFSLCILGVIGYTLLPVSLLPDISIPEINIQVNAPGRSAKDIEDIMISPIRRQLLTVDGLEDISSRSADNYGCVSLRFKFDSDIDLALININEKVYKITDNMPEDFERPKVFKSNVTDIPVEYITMTLKDDKPFGQTNTEEFITLSDVCENVVARRLEQLRDVAMVDISGLTKKELQVKPDPVYMESAGITNAEIMSAIKSYMVRPVSMRVRDGVYEYTIYIENSLATMDDLANVTIRKNGRFYRLGDICTLSLGKQEEIGRSLHHGKRCVTLAVIKKHESKVNNLKKEITKTLNTFSTKYPGIEFTESRDQTDILNYSIRTLKQNFMLSLALMFIIAFIFMGDVKTPLVTAISMSVALIISFLAFFVFKISLNILSLSGLILVVGMMIDNILITSENIMRHQLSGEGLTRSCAKGTAEMITPMLSSTLTTIIVFVPLIFISDLAGALFFDQSLAISIGLIVSYLVSLFLLPILFMLFGRLDKKLNRFHHHRRFSERLSLGMSRIYDRTMNRAAAGRKVIFAGVILSLPLCYLAYLLLPKSQMPDTDNREVMMKVTWDAGLPLSENEARTSELIDRIAPMADEISASVGTQGYMMEAKNKLSVNQSELYIKAATPQQLDSCVKSINKYLAAHYPDAVTEISATDNLFDRLFTSDKPPVVVKVYSDNRDASGFLNDISKIRSDIQAKCNIATEHPVTRKEMTITLDREAMDANNVNYEDIENEISSAFKEIPVSGLSATSYIPVVIKDESTDWASYMAHATVMPQNANGPVALSYLLRYNYNNGLADLQADNKGVMYPIAVYPSGDAQKTADRIQKDVLNHHHDIRTAIGGSVIEEAGMFATLVWIFVLSMVLMYFILCVQFESFVQPLVVLAEIPVDVCFALFSLLIFGYSFNIMSGIGIIASCGIVVNDSILKIDAINKLIAKGMPVQEAIHTAGKLRIRPIVMTSLTTIIAMLPFFFTEDLGSELQQPLALGMIATLAIGTVVSLFVIPLLFEYLILKRRKTSRTRMRVNQ
ncbi:MAG: efflux RND transporter permease subunit [Prevotella sp.]